VRFLGRSAKARDRDCLRQQQLEALGSRFHRIWSTGWFTRREEYLQPVLQAFQAAVARRCFEEGLASVGAPFAHRG
jgi:REase_MTES_1575